MPCAARAIPPSTRFLKILTSKSRRVALGHYRKKWRGEVDAVEVDEGFCPDVGVSNMGAWGNRVTTQAGLGFRPDLTGRENALLSCLLRDSAKRRKNSLEGIEDFAELGDFFDQPVKTYSTGMRARLGFAAALMNRSDVILIDEVLSVGDQHFD